MYPSVTRRALQMKNYGGITSVYRGISRNSYVCISNAFGRHTLLMLAAYFFLFFSHSEGPVKHQRGSPGFDLANFF